MHVTSDMMEGMRASTEAYALMNARIIRDKLGATWALSETGASGPTSNRYGDATGHACMAVVGPVERSMTLETGSADREANMWTFAQTALDLLESCIKEQG
jgi:nicotinamide mononucleotide (NMN) deamidase PncC